MNGLIFNKRLSNYFTQLKGIKIFGFGIVHASGLGLDLVVFISFLYLGFKPLIANISAGIIGVTFDYFYLPRTYFFTNQNFYY